MGWGGAEPAKLAEAAGRGAAVAPPKAGWVPTGPTRRCCHLTALGETAFCDSAVFIPARSPAQRGFPWKTSIQNKEREGATAGVTQPQLEASASEAGKGGLFPTAWSCSSSGAQGWSRLSPARATATSQAAAWQVWGKPRCKTIWETHHPPGAPPPHACARSRWWGQRRKSVR